MISAGEIHTCYGESHAPPGTNGYGLSEGIHAMQVDLYGDEIPERRPDG